MRFFFRNTHTKDGVFKEEFFKKGRDERLDEAWARYGSIVHALDHKKGKTIQEVIEQEMEYYWQYSYEWSEEDISKSCDNGHIVKGLAELEYVGYVISQWESEGRERRWDKQHPKEEEFELQESGIESRPEFLSSSKT